MFFKVDFLDNGCVSVLLWNLFTFGCGFARICGSAFGGVCDFVFGLRDVGCGFYFLLLIFVLHLFIYTLYLHFIRSCFKCSTISLLFILFHFRSVYSNGYGFLVWISVWLECVLCFQFYLFLWSFFYFGSRSWLSYGKKFSSLWMDILFFYFWFWSVIWLEEILVFVNGYGWNVRFNVWIVNLLCVRVLAFSIQFLWFDVLAFTIWFMGGF